MSSATSFTTTVPIFQGKRGKYYIYDGEKYDIHFPLAWAMNHKGVVADWNNQFFGSGPKDCLSCLLYYSINGVFVGYCSNCLRHLYPGNTRGNWEICSRSINSMLTIDELHQKYPYMSEVESLSDIGDEDQKESDVPVCDVMTPKEFRELYYSKKMEENLISQYIREPEEEPENNIVEMHQGQEENQRDPEPTNQGEQQEDEETQQEDEETQDPDRKMDVEYSTDDEWRSHLSNLLLKQTQPTIQGWDDELSLDSNGDYC
jgi:hypothetical protein